MPEMEHTLLNERITHLEDIVLHNQEHIESLNKIGAALSAENNLDVLLEMILSEARRFTKADAGTFI